MAIKLQATSNFAKIVIVAELILVSYLLYTLTLSVYKSYQIEQHIKNYDEQNKLLEEENQKKKEEYEYITSERYIEKLAKQNLGLVNFGEEVIVIPNSDAGRSGIVGGATSGVPQDENTKFLSNSEKWWIFFFDRPR